MYVYSAKSIKTRSYMIQGKSIINADIVGFVIHGDARRITKIFQETPRMLNDLPIVSLFAENCCKSWITIILYVEG